MSNIHKKIIVCIAAYDAGMHTSEGFIIRQILRHMTDDFKVILITRNNNVAVLNESDELNSFSCEVVLSGFDLPAWMAWWKKGPRGYTLYAYLWQLLWPLFYRWGRRIDENIDVYHTFNFHNDSIPNLSWLFSQSTVWGPINHNENVEPWRLDKLNLTRRLIISLRGIIRGIHWKIDPFLRMTVSKTAVILSAGEWVDKRLGLQGRNKVIRKSQLGGAGGGLRKTGVNKGGLQLLTVGRLDWIKGLEICIEALANLPNTSSLTIVGSGDERIFLREQVERFGISSQVTFIDRLEHGDLMKMMVDFDLFLFPSAEAGGLVWVEALCAGLPVLGMERPSELTMMAEKLSGVFVTSKGDCRKSSVRNYSSDILKISELYHDSDRISDSALKAYDWPVFSTQLMSIYRKLIDEKANSVHTSFK